MFLFSVARRLCEELSQSVSFGNCIERIWARVSKNHEENYSTPTKGSWSFEITFEKVGGEWIQDWSSAEFDSSVVCKA